MKTCKMLGWFPEFHCGRVGPTARYKKNVLAYCPIHGDDTIHIYPDYQEPAPYDREQEDMRE